MFTSSSRLIMEAQRYDCSMCFYTTIRHALLIRHLVRNHRFDPRFLVRCSARDCGVTYKNWNSFKKHVYRNHRDVAEGDEGDDALENDNLLLENDVNHFLQTEDGEQGKCWLCTYITFTILDNKKPVHNV